MCSLHMPLLLAENYQIYAASSSTHFTLAPDNAFHVQKQLGRKCREFQPHWRITSLRRLIVTSADNEAAGNGLLLITNAAKYSRQQVSRKVAGF